MLIKIDFDEVVILVEARDEFETELEQIVIVAKDEAPGMLQ